MKVWETNMGDWTFAESMELVARFFEAIGALILIAGLVVSAFLAIRSLRLSKQARLAYEILRESFGGAILLGLEVLVAADLVRTVAVAPTIENVAILGLIVLIRTILSFSLEIEIEGVAPWRKAAMSGASRIAHAAKRSGEAGGVVGGGGDRPPPLFVDRLGNRGARRARIMGRRPNSYCRVRPASVIFLLPFTSRGGRTSSHD
jgi:uncharacterized membrane protein